MSLFMNIHLFAAWCGLVGSGYSLSDQEDRQIEALCREVKRMAFPRSVLEYFSEARTDTVAVNPYYPRGSDLSCACFFLGKPIGELLCFLSACGSPDAGDAPFESWIARLPDVLKQVEKREDFQRLFERYRVLSETRFSGVDGEIERLLRRAAAAGIWADVSVTFVPNLLQSKYLADYVMVDRDFYVIAPVFSENGVLHEYLHICLRGSRDVLREILCRYGVEAFVDVGLMKTGGYMRDDSEDSRIRVLEDCFVRAMANALCKTEAKSSFQRDRAQGFTATAAMAGALLNPEQKNGGTDAVLRRMAGRIGG